MKTLAIMIMLALALEASAKDRPSVHGMLVVGTNQLYLSHLPMFHTPHDYQVILEVEIPPAARRTYLENNELHAESVYTIVPEAFVLPEMVQKPRPFTAQLYRGHFERGGVLIDSNVMVVIKRVVHFQKLARVAARPRPAQYLAFGADREWFLAHVITGRPNFDQLVELSSKVSMGVLALDLDDTIPLEQGKTYESSAGAVRVKEAIYLEFGDLSH